MRSITDTIFDGGYVVMIVIYWFLLGTVAVIVSPILLVFWLIGFISKKYNNYVKEHC